MEEEKMAKRNEKGARVQELGTRGSVPLTPGARSLTPDSVWVYIGPGIRGVLRRGHIFCGTREAVDAELSAVYAQYPEARLLVVADTELAAAKAMLRRGGNALHHAAEALRT